MANGGDSHPGTDNKHPETQTHKDVPTPAKVEEAASTKMSAEVNSKPASDNKPAADTKSGSDSKPAPPATSAESHLPHIHLVGQVEKTDGGDNPAPAAKLSDSAVHTQAEALRAALGERSLLGLAASPNQAKVEQLLGPLSHADRLAVEDAFNHPKNADGSPAQTQDLRGQLKTAFGPVDGTRLESILNREDGRSNDAGAVRTAIMQSQSDPSKGSAQIEQIFRELNSQQVAQLNSDYQKQYGHDLASDIKGNQNLTPALRDAFDTLSKGSDKRTSEDVQAMARIAVQNKDKDLLTNTIAGDTPEVVAARTQLQADSGFRKQFAQAFPNTEQGSVTNLIQINKGNPDQATDRATLDYLQQGHAALATIAAQDTNPLFFKNKENLELSLRNATPQERADYQAGRDLAASHTEAKTPQEKQALDFYNRLHTALSQGGNARENAKWEDQLLNGRRTLVSEMADTHSDGYTPLGLGSGHKTSALMDSAENISRKDWETLHNPATAEAFKTQIEKSLGAYATPDESKRIMQMLKEKAAAPTFEDSSKIGRNLEDTINDSRSSTFAGMGTTYDTRPIMDRLAHLSPADASKYHDNQAYRQKIDAIVNDNFMPGDKLYARTMLDQVARTGQPAVEGPAEKVIGNSVRHVTGEKSIADVETLLADKGVRDRLSQPDNKLSQADKDLKLVISNTVFGSVSEKMPSQSGNIDAQERMTDQQMQQLMTTGRLSPSTKLQWGYDRQNLYAQAATASPAERAACDRYFSDGEKQMVDVLAKQNGQAKLEDQLRSFVLRPGSDYQGFQDQLRGLTNEQKQDLKNAYESKYHSTLNQDFLQKISAQDENVYRQYLNPSNDDGKQDSYDNYRHFLDSRSGTAPDGTALTAERASELQTSAMQNYQRQYAKLNDHQKEAMNQFFGQAIKENQESKQKLAEVLTDASITAAALAAAPFTAGLSTAALVSVIGTAAVAGAGVRVAVFKGIEGGDFDGSAQNLTKQALIGGTTAALSMVGPELFAMSGKFTTTAAGAMAKDLTAGGVAMRPGAEGVLRNELAALSSKKGFSALSEAEVKQLAEKVAAPGISDAQKATLQNAIADSARVRMAEAGEGLSRDVAARATLARQVGDNAMIGAGGNAASELVVAPLNENGVDWERLGQGALTGAAFGAIVPVAFRAFKGRGHGDCVVSTNVGRDQQGAFIDPKTLTEDISLRNTRTGQVETIRPGDGDKFRLTNEWQYESGGRMTPDVSPEVRPVAPSERMTPAELKDVSRTIASNLGDKSVTPEQFKQIFEGEYTIGGVKRTLTPDERKLAAEVMEQAMPNMDSRAIDQRMVELRDKLAADPNWAWQKRTDPFGRPYDGVNVLVLDGTTDGNALSHLFNKNSGVTPTVKVLQGADLERMQMGLDQIEKLEKTNQALATKYSGNLDQIINQREGKTVRQVMESNSEGINNIRGKYDLDNALIFDDVRNATPAQQRVLAGMKHLAVADLNGFNRSPNIYDYASLGFGAGADAMRGRMGAIIERAEAIQKNGAVTREEAVRQAIDENYAAQARTTLPNANVVETAAPKTGRAARDSVAEGASNPEAYREQSLYQEITKPLATPEQIQNFLGRLSSDQQRLGARVLEDGLVVNNYGTMIDQARALHQKILDSVPGHDPKNMLIVTGLEENGSAYLTNSLYSRANGLTADNFVSVQDLRNLAAKKPGEKLTPYQQHLKEELGNRRLVYLDDYAYSGRQMPSLINNLQQETLARLTGPDGKPLVSQLTVGTLGRYQLRENTWENAANLPNLHPSADKPGLQVNVAESPSVYQQLYDSPFFRNQLSQEERDRVQLWLGAQSLYSHSTINTTMILPYGGPNNNIPWIQAFIESRNGLGLPARYKNADWSELEAGSAEFDRNKVLGEIVKPPAR